MLADVIVVTYHSLGAATPELNRFVTLAGLADPRVHWSFVDNSEDSSDADYLEASLAQAGSPTVLRRPDNPGFAASCNEAARASRAQWLLFINPDILLDQVALDRIVTGLAQAADDVSCMALSQQTGSFGHQGVSVNRAGWFMDRRVTSAGSSPAELARAPVRRVVRGAEQLIGPSGGAAAFRTEAFLECSGFYEPLFAWGEDADLALRMHLGGHTCVPLDLALPHQGGHSVSAGEVTRRRAGLLVGNRITIAARLYSVPQTAVFGAFLVAALIGKAPRMIRQGTVGAHLGGVARACRGIRRARASYSGPRLGLGDDR